MPSLEEIRARKSQPVAVPKASEIVTLIEGQHLYDELDRLRRAQADIIAAAARAELTEDQADSQARARKAAERAATDDLPPEVEENAKQAMAVRDRLQEHQATVGLSGLTPGAWQRYKDDHPPRVIDHQRIERENGEVIIGEPIYDRLDETYGAGMVDFSAVMADLGQFVATWDDEPVPAGEWDSLLRDRVIYDSQRMLAVKVVGMHEQRVNRVPFSQSASSETGSGTSD